MSRMILLLKRCLCAAICYGMVFTYPSWTLFSRIAHANPASQGVGVPSDQDLRMTAKSATPTAPATRSAAPASPAVPATPKPPAPSTTPPAPPPVSPPPAPVNPDGSDVPPAQGQGDAAKQAGGDAKHLGKGEGKDEKKGSEPPVGASCSDDKFYLSASNGSGANISGDEVCGSKFNSEMIVTSNCWKQFFTFLGAADANAYYVNNANPDRSPASAVAARTISTTGEFIPKLGQDLSGQVNETGLTNIIDRMSRPDIVKDGDNRTCCMQLVEQAQKVAYQIQNSKPNKNRTDLTANKKTQEKMQAMIAQQKQRCETGHGGAVVVGGHGEVPPPAAPPPEKKKRNGALLAILIALGIGLLIWAVTRKKKKNKKPRPTETPPGCKGSGCGGGGGGSAETGGGGTTCSSNGCANTTGATTGEEPPVTTGSYPGTTGDDGRDTTTGGTGTGGTPDDPDIGRDTTTGGTGTVTGSTTAEDPTTSTTTTGDDLNVPVDDNDGGRVTGGNDRTLIKN